MKKIKEWKISEKVSEGKGKLTQKVSEIKEKSMAKMESDEMLDLSAKLRMHRMEMRIRYLVITGIVGVLLAAVMIYGQVHVYHRYSIKSSVERSDDAVTQYVRVKKNRTLKCNPNGVTCVNDKNEVQWNTTFNMQSLMVDVCGSTVVVGDQRGSLIYVFDEDGLLGSYEVEYTLMKVRVAKQGVVAAVLEDGETTWINVYDVNGNILVKNKTSMAESGYPLDVALSTDGLKMAVSYLATDRNDIKTKIAFYNFSAVGQGQTNNLVNLVEYEGQVVPEVRFMDNGYAVAFADDGLTFFSGRQVPEERTRIQVQQEIISLFCDEEYVGIVTPSDEEEQLHKYKMQIYHSNGSKSMTKYFDEEYTDIKINDGEIIMFDSNDLTIYTVGGKKKFSGTYEKAIQDVIKGGGSRKYSVVTSDSTDQIKIK